MIEPDVLVLEVIDRGLAGYRLEVPGDTNPLKVDLFCRSYEGAVRLCAAQFPYSDFEVFADDSGVGDSGDDLGSVRHIGTDSSLEGALARLRDLALLAGGDYALEKGLRFDFREASDELRSVRGHNH
jgi:hypothetical protein